ncbi:GNAT family N-acetyltransferase [Lapidilactobacillus salsurivasis]
MLNFQIVTQLSDQQTEEIVDLIAQCHLYDGGAKDPYLDNRFNYFQEMPWVALASSNQHVVGVATIYADAQPPEEAEMAVFVLPQKRRQGIGRRLGELCQTTLHQYGYDQWEYWTELAFLNREPDFLAAIGLTADPNWELQMARPQQATLALPARAKTVLRPLSLAEIPAVLPIYQAAFPENTVDSTRQYLLGCLQDQQNDFQVLWRGSEPLGACAINLDVDRAYLFSLFISPERQGNGWGTYLLNQLCLTYDQVPTLRLSVEASNVQAHHLYERAGFQVETTVIYLDCPEPKRPLA